MPIRRFLVKRFFVPALVGVLLLAATLRAADEPTVMASAGLIVKANAEVVILRPREAGGKFGKAVTLKVRGTSKVFALSVQKRDGQSAPVQKEIAAKDLTPNQPLTVLHAVVNDENVLLLALAQPAAAQ
jgi:hypothetical protein